MTTLADAILEILSTATVSMRADSLGRVLFVTGFDSGGRQVPVEQVDITLDELLRAGQVKRVNRRGVASYRAVNGAPA